MTTMSMVMVMIMVVFSCGSIVRASEEGHCWGPIIMRPVSGVYKGFVKLSLPLHFLAGLLVRRAPYLYAAYEDEEGRLGVWDYSKRGVLLHVVELRQISYIVQSLNRKPKAWEGPKYTHITYCCGAESLETVPSSGYLKLPGDVRQEKLERELPGGSRRHSTSEW